jgi:adenine-specific DNA-methyltransferase
MPNLNNMDTIIQDLEKVLKKDDRFFSEVGEILKNKVSELAFAYDEKLLASLHSNTKLRKQFFVELKDKNKLIFKVDDFVAFINRKEFLPDSFTKFKNRIGLQSNNEYLRDKGDVVLAFPYKDCVLEGGQDKDDQKRDEVFYNEVLAPDEIDRLFEPKVLTNFKKFDKSGEKSVSEITEQDNLIIKGNNLLALHSLKEKYKGKVKLIYIDPPYNTGGDSFGYNDKFNHSSWLVFMKNRLEVARDFLKEDGVIFVQCDDNEQAYLKVLMDEVFGIKNFISTVIDIVKPEGRRYGFIAQAHEYLLVYGKDLSKTKMYEMTSTDKKLPYKDDKGNFDIVGLRNRAVNFFNSTNRPNLYYPFYVNKNNVDDDGFMPVSTVQLDGYTEVLPSVVDGMQSVWRWGKEKAMAQSNEVVARTGSDGTIRIFKKDYSKTTMPTSFWQDKELITQKGTQQVDKLFDEKAFAFPKPEALLKRIIEISTKEGDIVLDYHLGSGTTSAVAHKMNRRWIGIEQMAYIETIAIERMKKTIKGEQGGVSKDVSWKGGGSFVFVELQEWNKQYIDNLEDAKTAKDVAKIYETLIKEPFFRYDVDLSQFDEKEFSKLSLDDQKKVLLKCLDKNHLYVNYCDINDATYKVSAEDKKLNKLFYAGN